MDGKIPPPRRLFLRRIDPSFDPERDYVIGPWCFVDAEHVVEQWEDLPFEDGFADSDAILAAWKQGKHLLLHWVRTLSVELSATHAIDPGLKFWWDVLIIWLLLVNQAAIGRWVCIEAFIRRHGDEALEIEVLDHDPEWDFADCLTYNLSSRGADFEFWLSSLAVKALAPPNWRLHPVPMPAGLPPLPRAARKVPERTSRLRQLVRRMLKRLPVSDIPGMGPVSTLLLSAYAGLLPRRSDRSFDPAAAPAPCLDGIPAALLALVERLVRTTMPRSFRGDFALYMDRASRQRYRPGRLTVTCAAKYNEYFRFEAALARARGERLVRVQHGSNTGTGKVLLSNEYDYRQHGVLTWGWREQEEYSDIFVPAPGVEPSKYCDAHRFEDRNLIMIGTNIEIGSHQFKGIPQSAGFVRYRRNKRHFLSALAPDPAAATLYRPYFRADMDLEEEEYLHRYFPTLPILGGDLHKAMLRCRLLVMDSPGTTLNLALAANTPTICFWEKDQWPFCRQAQPYFDALTEAGILFYDPAAAADQVNAVWPRVEAWWREPRVQAARQAWVRQYAWASRWWWVHWMRALTSL